MKEKARKTLKAQKDKKTQPRRKPENQQVTADRRRPLGLVTHRQKALDARSSTINKTRQCHGDRRHSVLSKVRESARISPIPFHTKNPAALGSAGLAEVAAELSCRHLDHHSAWYERPAGFNFSASVKSILRITPVKKNTFATLIPNKTKPQKKTWAPDASRHTHTHTHHTHTHTHTDWYTFFLPNQVCAHSS